ncbi:MAG: threonine aldolase family protein [Ferrovibrionaceae bacterium]
MDFRSDNVAGAHPAMIEALIRANQGTDTSYGGDAITGRVERRLRDIFETDCIVFPVATGTAANALALSTLVSPWGAVYCHRDAHVEVDEAGAPEFYTAGAKMVLVDGAHAKVTAAALSQALGQAGFGVEHHVQPQAVSISQASERGAVYRPGEVAALAEIARGHGMRLHMDGARFGNALVSTNATAAELTWKAGVDVLSFGATKNGALGAEAVIFFDRGLAENFQWRRKRAGHLFSKMRFLSAQLDAYLDNDLWLANARHANDAARRLAEGLRALPGVRLVDPVEANEIFVELPEAMIQGLEAAGGRFHRWGPPGTRLVRLVCSFATSAAEVENFVGHAKALA